jgi:thiamine monophosphate synthase
LGDITPENASAVIKAGAKGVAMMRSVSEADDPKAAVQAFIRVITE